MSNIENIYHFKIGKRISNDKAKFDNTKETVYKKKINQDRKRVKYKDFEKHETSGKEINEKK